MLATPALLAAACMEPLDPEQPIALKLDPAFTPREEGAIRATARCWNMELGTQLVLNDDAVEQQVPVYPSALACDYAGGITFYPGGPEVSICELTRRDIGVYQVMLHELGHVLNIMDHAKGDEAVMGAGLCISKVDRAMFFAANPGFKGQEGPDRTHRLALDHGGIPSLIKVGQQVVVLWFDHDKRFPFQLLEARSGRPTKVQGTLRGPGIPYVGVPFAFSAPGGVGVFWYEYDGPRVARIRLPTGAVDPARKLLIKGDGVAVAPGDDALYLATRDDAHRISVQVVELVGGRWRARALASIEGALTARALTYYQGQLYLMGLVGDAPRTVRVIAISTAGAVRVSRDYTSLGPWPLRIRATAGGDALYYANPVEDPLAGTTIEASTAVHVLRVDVAGGGLGRATTAYVELPAEVTSLDLPQIAHADGKLWLVNNDGIISNWQDVVLSALDGQTLQRSQAWQRVSPPDFCGARSPAILGQEGQLLLVWDQWIDGPKSRVVLTR